METLRSAGEVLRIVRIANNYTRKEAATKSKITHGYIAEIENCKWIKKQNISSYF